jgi:WD40 repeat protein
VIESEESVHSLAFSPDSEILVTGEDGGEIKVWDLTDEALLYETTVYTGTVDDLAFSPIGNVLAYAATDYPDYHVGLLDTTEWSPLITLDEYDVGAAYLAFSPDGEILITGSKELYFWKVSDGSLLHTLKDHAGHVMCVAFSSDGALLASGSRDGTIRLWGVP